MFHLWRQFSIPFGPIKPSLESLPKNAGMTSIREYKIDPEHQEPSHTEREKQCQSPPIGFPGIIDSYL